MSARRVSSVDQRAAVRVGRACGRRARGLLGAGAVAQRVLGVGGAAGAEDRHRGVLAREHDRGGRERELAAGAGVLVEGGLGAVRERWDASREELAGPSTRRLVSISCAGARSGVEGEQRERSWAAGSSCATEPQTVPRLRVAAWPTLRTAWASSGQWRAISGERSSVAWRTVRPIWSVPSVRRRTPRDRVDVHEPARPARWLSSGTRLWPPARTWAPSSRERGDGLLDRAHGHVLERRGLHRQPRRDQPCGAPGRGERGGERRGQDVDRGRVGLRVGVAWRSAGGCGRRRARASR